MTLGDVVQNTREAMDEIDTFAAVDIVYFADILQQAADLDNISIEVCLSAGVFSSSLCLTLSYVKRCVNALAADCLYDLHIIYLLALFNASFCVCLIAALFVFKNQYYNGNILLNLSESLLPK